MRPVGAIVGRRKDDRAPVRRPRGREIVAAGTELSAESDAPCELGTREQARSLGAWLERLNEQARLAIVEPAVPEPDRRIVIDARVVLARLALRGGGAVGRVGRCAR